MILRPDSWLEMEGKSFEAKESVEWNHGLGEIVGALLAAGMRLTALVEHQSVPWNALPGLMVEVGGGESSFLLLFLFGLADFNSFLKVSGR